MPQVAAWMNISDQPSLYESSFCDMQYWGPASPSNGAVTGFDKKAIDHPLGRFFGEKDIVILEL